MKFEREIPIGLDAWAKKKTGGAKMAPPMGLGLKEKETLIPGGGGFRFVYE